tara:strand:- start:57315 stop:57629 length:315 start_codon:yes stop_codon:yes gene_type:complete
MKELNTTVDGYTTIKPQPETKEQLDNKIYMFLSKDSLAFLTSNNPTSLDDFDFLLEGKETTGFIVSYSNVDHAYRLVDTCYGIREKGVPTLIRTENNKFEILFS